MKTNILFYDYNTKERSDCADAIEIEISSYGLGWDGIILEKGFSRSFHPDHVSTPYFYFVQSLDDGLSWTVCQEGQPRHLATAAGEIWINPPDIPFTHKVDQPCHFIILALDRAFVMPIIRQMDPAVSDSLEYISNYNIDDMVMHDLMKLIYQEALRGGSDGTAYAEALARAFTIHYIKNYSNFEDLRNDFTRRIQTIDSKTIHRIELFIDERIASPVSVGQLAQQANLSQFYFLREFKEVMGITPYQFVLQRRLNKAKDYLTNSDYSTARIAAELGFADQSHFNRTFKSHIGISPLAYRKNVKSNI